MALSAIKRYLKIYWQLFRFSLMRDLSYPTSFLTQLAVELGYNIIFLLFINVIYSRISQVAGWTYYEVLFLSGLSIITSESLLGALYVFNLWELPNKIKNGDIDPVLLKPVHSLFYLSLGTPYCSGFVSALPGIYLLAYSLSRLNIPIPLLNILMALVVFICGLLIAFSVSVIISALAFVFTNAQSLPRLANQVIFNWTEKPHTIYTGILRYLFFLIIPVVYLNSIPASIILKHLDWLPVFLAILLAGIFLYLAITVWNKLILYYSSASS